MWFKRRRNEFGCPMCGRLPKIVKSHTQDGDYIKSIYRLQCPRKHLSTNWYSDPMDASINWKHVVNEYSTRANGRACVRDNGFPTGRMR